MAKGKVNSGIEQADAVYTATVTGTGQINLGLMLGYYNLFIYGTFSATAQLERSFDGGSTWVAVSLDTSGDPASYTSAVSLTGFEPEKAMFYRINCTAYTSGTMNVRLSGNLNFAGGAWGA